MNPRHFLLLGALAAPSLLLAQDPAPVPAPAQAPAPAAPVDSSAIEIDRIVAVVGSHPILLSDVFAEIGYMRQQGMPAPRDAA